MISHSLLPPESYLWRGGLPARGRAPHRGRTHRVYRNSTSTLASATREPSFGDSKYAVKRTRTGSPVSLIPTFSCHAPGAPTSGERYAASGTFKGADLVPSARFTTHSTTTLFSNEPPA